MKRATIIAMLVVMLFPVIIYASFGSVPDPDVVLEFRDRIRNVIAVESATEPSARAYVSTFGISAVGSQDDEIPVFIIPQIYRFRMYNSEYEMDFYDGCQLLMNDDFIQANAAVDYLICYDENELASLLSWYPDEQWFGGLRYGSGCGFWSSPVLYRYSDEVNYLFALNKSGLLLIIDADYGSSFQQAVYAAIDLRDMERDFVGSSSFALEYASTPVAIGDYLYVAGLQSFFKINISNPSAIESSVSMQNIGGLSNSDPWQAEYFFSAVTWDFNAAGEIILSATTRSHNDSGGHTIIVNGNLIQQPINEDNSGHNGIPLCYDYSGYTYVPESTMYRMPRDLRESDYEGHNLSQINQVGLTITYGDILSDFSGNLIFQTLGASGIQVTDMGRSYAFMNNSPISEIGHHDYGYLANFGGIQFQFDANNHGLVFEDPEQKRSLVVSICSTDRSGHDEVSFIEEGIPLFYDDHKIYDENGYVFHDWGMRIGMLNLDRSGNGVNQSWTNPEHLIEDSSYGGLAPYKTIENHINILYGTERGYVRSYTWHLPSEAVNYPFRLEFDEPVISNTSKSKFQRDVTNNCSYPWVENHQVIITDVPGDYNIEAVFGNGYRRVAEERNESYEVVFERLQAHPNYTFGFRYTDDEEQRSVREISHVSIPEQSPLIIPFDLDLVVLSDEDITIDTPNISYNSITIHNNGILRIETHPVFTNELILYDGSQLKITDTSILNAYSCNCISESENPDPATINLYFAGHLNITTEMSFGLDTFPCPAYCRVEGGDENNMRVSDLTLGAGDAIDISLNENADGTEATLRVKKADYMCGDIQISGTMRVLSKLDIRENGHVGVSDGGHLIMCPTEGNQTSTADIDINRTGTALEVASGGKLTFRTGATLVPENSATIVDIAGTLSLEQGVELDVENGVIAMRAGSNIFMSHGILHMTLNSTLLLSCEGVTITGSKAKDEVNDLPADQIVIDGGGDMKSDGEHTDYIYNVTIASSDERWKGIMFDPPTHFPKLLIDWNVAGVEMLRFTGNQNDLCWIKLQNCHIDDCTYGVRAEGVKKLSINASSFVNCVYGVYANRVDDVEIYVEDNGGNPENAVFDGNQYAVVIKDADTDEAEKINNYWFENNEVAISYRNSFMNIGGYYRSLYEDYVSEGSCNFFGNDVAIEGSIYGVDQESVIMDCWFEINEYEALYLFDQYVRIYNNDFIRNGRNAIWSYKGQFQQMKDNYFENNGGAEIIGYLDVFNSMTGGNNTLVDTEYDFFPIPDPPDLWSASQMDRFLLARLDHNVFDVADVSGNTIPHNDPARFYPSISSFDFGDGLLSDPKSLYYFGVDEYKDGSYTSAEFTFSNLVTNYPESSYSVSALIYFLYIESETDQDYEALRARLDALVSEDYPDLYKEKEYVVTQSYLYEEKYLDVIERLEDTIASPDTKMDSVVALATQGYCYVQLAEEGTRALPQKCTVRTETYEEYLEYMRNLRMTLNGEVETSQAPSYTFSLDANYPNPFNPTTTISFSIPKDDKVELKVYNIKGQLVKTLVNDHLEAGRHKAVWDGDNKYGKSVSSGIYLYRLESCGKSKAQKMLLLK